MAASEARPESIGDAGSTLRNRSPVLPLIGALILVANLGWAAAAAFTPNLPNQLPWVLTSVCISLAAVACFRTAAALSGPAARFWRFIGFANAAGAAGTVVNLTVPPEVGGHSVVADGCYAVAMSCAIWGLIRIPLGRRSRRDWLTVCLDMATMLLGAGVFVWHFSFRSLITQAPAGRTYSILLLVSALEFVVLLVVAKLVVFGTGPIHRNSLIMFGFAMAAATLFASAMPAIMTAYADAGIFSVPLACTLEMVAADLQRRALRRGPAAPRRRGGRPFSLLPYLAVGATAMLLIGTVRRDADEAMTVALSMVAITALVVIRQIVTFYDNAELLERLDGTLLEVRHHEERLSSLLRNSSDIVTVTAADGTLTYASPGLARLLGRLPDELIGGSLQEFVHPEDLAALRAGFEGIVTDDRGASTYSVRARSADGSWRWFEVVSTNLLDDPSVQGVVANARDVTQTRRYHDELAHQATHDELTQLANRSLFRRRTRAALVAAPLPERVVVALVDLDDFKVVNDRIGHAVGDDLLVAVAARLHEAVREHDMVARLGGDEFAVLLDDAPPAAVDEIIEQVRAALVAPITVGQHRLFVRASIGVADATPGPDREPEVDDAELLRRADVAMYAAKARGKGCYVRYQPELDEADDENARLAAELAHGIAAGQLRVVYQPIVGLPSGVLNGVEALVRWEHPERGTISPADFIPVAERTGLIVPLGDYVLRTACQQAADWDRRYGARAPRFVSVNVAAHQLRERDFAAAVTDVLQRVGLVPGRLTVEVTETAVFDDGQALATLQAVHDLGVRVALDDFGTGHSSLRLLRTCPVDVLKVDKSFIDNIPGTRQQVAIATSLADIAAALDLAAVAEGVETEVQAVELFRMGYRLAQGFHFARPMPVSGIDALIGDPAPASYSLAGRPAG